jgi:peptidoglycan lytic transglycosylase
MAMLALLAATCVAWCAHAALASAATGTAGEASGAAGVSGGTGSTAQSGAKIAPSGIATWFGPGFYGQKTACGQTMTPVVVGVANRTLRCGTLVRVTYRGHALVLPVIDRGPYAHNGASWDLTAGAANALEVSETVRVSIRVVGSTPNIPTLGAPPVTAAEALSGGAQAG